MLSPYISKNEAILTSSRSSSDMSLADYKTRELFAKLRWRAKFNRLVALVVPGLSLVSLKDIERSRPITSQYYAGLRRVPLQAIVGSENKSQDFDRNFNPLHDYQEQRWLRVAQAYQDDRLPPVALVEIEGRYFVRDGHHRVSVARAMGAVEIDAEVVVRIPAAKREVDLEFCQAAA